MTSEQTRERADQARRIYEERLRAALEAEHAGRYVAIEPDSGDYLSGQYAGRAADAAESAHPARRAHVLRVGHPAALHIGGATS